jgi:hypothetical protein
MLDYEHNLEFIIRIQYKDHLYLEVIVLSQNKIKTKRMLVNYFYIKKLCKETCYKHNGRE